MCLKKKMKPQNCTAKQRKNRPKDRFTSDHTEVTPQKC